MQNLVLLTFARIGVQAHEGIHSENEVKARRKGEPLSEKNRDGISEQLFTYSELTSLFQSSPGWFESMRDLLLTWSQEVVTLSNNTVHKAMLRR